MCYYSIGQWNIIKKDERIEKINTYMFHIFMYSKFNDSSNINNKNLLEKDIQLVKQASIRHEVI